MELSWAIVIAGIAIALAVFSAGAMVTRAIQAFVTVFYAALSTPARYQPDYTQLESEDPDEITSHLPPWDNPTALEVVAWQFAGVKEALFALRDRIGGSPASAEESKR
jgi:hypothetical protein